MINDKTADEILEELGYVRLDLDNIISYIYIKDPNSGNNISIIPYPYSKFSDDYLDYIVKMQGRSSKYNIGDTIYLYYNIIKLISKEKADEYIKRKRDHETYLQKLKSKKKKCKCPKCGKWMPRIAPYESGIYNFKCNNCDSEVHVKWGKENSHE